MSVIRGVCLTVSVAIGSLMFAGAPALASLAYGPITSRIGSLGVVGAGDGEFSTPDGVAVDQATGDVYVVDTGNNRVEEFSAAGGYLAQFNGSDAPGGPFEGPSAITVDNDPTSPAYGDVYVADSGHNVVDKFTSAGAYVAGSQITGQSPSAPEPKAFSDPDGLAVDPTNGPAGGDLYVADKNNKLVDIFTSSGEWVSEFPTAEGKPWTLAIDSNGNVYVAAAGAVRVTEYAPMGESVVKFFSESHGGFGNARTVGVDLADDNVFLGTEFTGVYQLEEVDSSGELTAQHDFGGEEMSAPNAASPGIAVDSSSGTVYAVDAGNDVVDIFAPVVLPTTETGSPSDVKGTTVTASGKVNPEGLEAHYFFEYGPCDENKSSPCPESPYPSKSAEEGFQGPPGSTFEPASTSLAGLTPETTYHYRLIAKNVNGESQGKEELVTSGPAVSDVSTTAASSLQPTSATLNGLLDPEGIPTHYFFEYISEEKYNSGAPNPYGEGANTEGEFGENDGGAQEAVGTPIAGLEVGTSYHYRIVASNEHGTTYGHDEVLVTPPALPILNNQQPSFATEVAPHEATLHGTVNPGRGITTYHFLYGPTAAYGSSTLAAYTQLNKEDDPVEHIVTGLQPDAVYHYALVATNASGTVVGPDEEFTTLEGPPALTEVGVSGGPSVEVTSTPGIVQPSAPALLPTPAFPAIKPLKEPRSVKCKKGFVRKGRKCVRTAHKKVKKRKKA